MDALKLHVPASSGHYSQTQEQAEPGHSRSGIHCGTPAFGVAGVQAITVLVHTVAVDLSRTWIHSSQHVISIDQGRIRHSLSEISAVQVGTLHQVRGAVAVSVEIRVA
jgi:hypothetical protein